MKRFSTFTVTAVSIAGFSACFQHAVAEEKKSTCSASCSDSAVETRVTDVKPDAAFELLKSENPPVILDIRTPGEFNAGHLTGATNIDYYADDFAHRLTNLDRTKPYLLHCRSGRRTSESLAIFQKLGFKKIYHLDAGMNAWVATGLPTEEKSVIGDN